jgi:hypothetical protein
MDKDLDAKCWIIAEHFLLLPTPKNRQHGLRFRKAFGCNSELPAVFSDQCPLTFWRD